MTPRERIQTFFRKEPVDTMPCFSGMGMVTIQAIEQMGIRFAQVHATAEYLAKSAMITAEMFGFDSVVIPYDMCTVPEALGCGASLYEDAEGILYPTVPNKWPSMDDIEIPKDFLSKGRMPVVDEAFRILLSQANGKFAVGGWVLGPFTMAGQIIELDLLLKGVRKERDKVVSFLDKMTDLVIEVAKHYQKLGVDYMNIREMGSGTDLLSPKMWKDLIQPNLVKIFEAIESPKILHICGSTDLIIEMMNECGADALSVDQKNNVAESRKKLGNDVLILGNFDPFGTLAKMGSSEVEGVIKKCIDDGVDAVWPGCDIWPDVKKENVEAYVKAVRQYGKAPSPAVGRI
ncbi:MAG: methyltransferase [Deltaproteobacteria bacterium]|nr:methyltransferase [Deltaproteobacteria bacterium]MBW1929536.1 methyltransferase [Deltaproteobacteria bacterium]MBW2024048.1 methyltransferase [Deltaproteobacteria bacterium]MBW2124399.1 methyltransferase [Deltaproteobacteria bacterium]